MATMKRRIVSAVTTWGILCSLLLPLPAMAKNASEKDVGSEKSQSANPKQNEEAASTSPNSENSQDDPSSSSPSVSEEISSSSGAVADEPSASPSVSEAAQPVAEYSSESAQTDANPSQERSTPATSSEEVKPDKSAEPLQPSVGPLPESTVGRISVPSHKHWLTAADGFELTSGMMITAYHGRAKLLVRGLGETRDLAGTPTQLLDQLGKLSFDLPEKKCEMLSLTLIPWADTQAGSESSALTAAEPLEIELCALSVWSMQELSSMTLANQATMLELEGVMSENHVPSVWPVAGNQNPCRAEALTGQPKKFKVVVTGLGKCNLAIGFQGSMAVHDQVSFDVVAPAAPTTSAEPSFGPEVTKEIHDKFLESRIEVLPLGITKRFGVTATGPLTENIGVVVNSQVDEREGRDSIVLPHRNRDLELSGDGFKPGTKAFIFMYSTPTLIGEATIDGLGNFTSTFSPEILDVFDPGAHTLRIVGVAPSGISWVLSAPVYIEAAVVSPPPVVDPNPGPNPPAPVTPTVANDAPITGPAIVIAEPPAQADTEDAGAESPAESVDAARATPPLEQSPVDPAGGEKSIRPVKQFVASMQLVSRASDQVDEAELKFWVTDLDKSQQARAVYGDRFTCMAPFGSCAIATSGGGLQDWILLLFGAGLLFAIQRRMSRDSRTSQKLSTRL